ncbi:hypothetical protein A2U01_0101032, partial [Trifolium medium]|nr:hypothetical protein [Trifolium medium]
MRYLQRDELPPEREDAFKIKKRVVWYSIAGDKLYKRGISFPMLLC